MCIKLVSIKELLRIVFITLVEVLLADIVKQIKWALSNMIKIFKIPLISPQIPKNCVQKLTWKILPTLSIPRLHEFYKNGTEILRVKFFLYFNLRFSANAQVDLLSSLDSAALHTSNFQNSLECQLRV